MRKKRESEKVGCKLVVDLLDKKKTKKLYKAIRSLVYLITIFKARRSYKIT